MSDNKPATRILVGTKYGPGQVDWKEHEGTYDEVVDRMAGRVLEGKGGLRGYEIVEVQVVRVAQVKPVITKTEITYTGLGMVAAIGLDQAVKGAIAAEAKAARTRVTGS